MSEQAQGNQRDLEAIQRQLADTRHHIAELEALISDLPEIYERKYEQQLQPLLEQERLLLQQNLLLRDQLQRALPGMAARLLLAPAAAPSPPTPAQAPPHPAPATAAPGPDRGAGPAQPPAQPQPSQPPAPRAEASPTAPSAAPTAPEPPNASAETGWLDQRNAATGPGKPSGQPRYRLALVATVAALGAFGLVQRQLVPGSPLRSPAPLGSTQASPQAPAVAGPSSNPPPDSGQASGSTTSGDTATQAGGSRGTAELLVITQGPSWIELRDSQGRTLYAALLEGRKRFRLGAGLSLKAGRPELVQVQLGSAPAQALPPGEWWTWHRFQPPGV